MPLRGSIDRVDVDGFGRAVVLDYKGSVGSRYNHYDSKQPKNTLPKKIQALVYAQVLRRAFGLEPVAAVYVSYGAQRGVGGLFNTVHMKGVDELPGINFKDCSTSEFLETLDWVEDAIAQKLVGLKSGNIEPGEKGAACEYCPMKNCPVRAGRKGGN